MTKSQRRIRLQRLMVLAITICLIVVFLYGTPHREIVLALILFSYLCSHILMSIRIAHDDVVKLLPEDKKEY